MKMQAESSAGYLLSSQQCSVHVADWQTRAPVNVILVEGPASLGQAQVLQAALDEQIRRHEILRTCYRPVIGLRYPMQHVETKLPAAWTTLEATVDDRSLMQSARSRLSLRDGPVIGAALAPAAAGRVRWALAAPAYSLDAMALQALIEACVTRSPAADVIQYPDYVAWQSELIASELGSEGARFWETQLPGAKGSERLPFEMDANADAGDSESVALSDEADAALGKLAKRLNLPLERVLLAAWGGFMARVMQTDDLSIDWHADVRSAELDGALGCFVMKLPVSLHFDAELSSDALIQSVAEQLRNAASWQECFDAAAHSDRLARIDRTRSRIEFAYVRERPWSEGWQLRHIELAPGDARLQCLCIDAGGGRVLRWQGVATHVRGTLRTWSHQFVTLLESLGRQPERRWLEQSMLRPAERTQLLSESRQETKPREHDDRQPRTLHGLFEAQVVRTPDAVAVVCDDEQLTYWELDHRADVFARRLRSRGVSAESCVGVHLGRSVDLITAMLAVLKSGAAYVPLDPGYPSNRLDGMIADAGISVVIGRAHERGSFSDSGIRLVYIDEGEQTPGDLAALRISPQQLAYVIYTSGSTGRPKGVMVAHANAVASTRSRFTFYRGAPRRFLLLSSPSFDSSVAGIYWTLAQGGALYIPPEGRHQDAAYLAQLVTHARISHLLALPSFYKQILQAVQDAGHLQCAIVAGEACHADVIEAHRRKAPAATLVNEYGPTEGTVWSNAFTIDARWAPGMRVPIGRTVDSIYGYVLDECLEPCPVGLPGEWYIGGEGITRGYLGRPALTTQRFVADPFGSGERLYRTGDRVRLRPDGEVEFLGRGDRQVKVRGYRIELDEIEAALRSHPRVREAAVLVHDSDELGQQLAGFFVLAATDTDHRALRDELLAHLRRLVPAFMVPAHLVPVASLPLMPNGKLDRQVLLKTLDRGLRAPYAAPGDDTERALAQIWQGVLKVERIGLHDNFFSLGGHSLLATQVASRIREIMAVDLPLKALFETATLAELASEVRQRLDVRLDDVAAMERLMADAQE
ncbi:non-ribosomal peptide synthetase [Peristeroidobacter soli]|uniref:non-ribosomal peptide synthetase n=1 Tax=Peristeroidobacter soli TaxID=2497877 RepID=UPI00101B7177|nr:non-ribosomal peptide synthetase [Peristeroidobacter soli]